MFSAHGPDDVDRFFRGITEYAFHARLGVADAPLVDYVALLLVRFLRHDATPAGTVAPRVADVAHLMARAAGRTAAEEAREEFRHVGDITLFWSGLYPEALVRRDRGMPLTTYRDAGRRAYRLAATLEPADAADERELFERLSEEYDLCVEGLAEVRRIWGED